MAPMASELVPSLARGRGMQRWLREGGKVPCEVGLGPDADRSEGLKPWGRGGMHLPSAPASLVGGVVKARA